MNGPLATAEPARATPPIDCRIYERFTSDAPVTCQPPSARGGDDLKWEARVRDVSAGGLCLVLRRRFEPGASLAIEMPGTDKEPGSTVFARVVRVKAEAGGAWALGCKFVSVLGDDELRPLLGPEVPAEAAPAEPLLPTTPPGQGTAADAVCVAAVHFRGVLPSARVFKCLIKNLTVKGVWPLPPGRTTSIRLGKPSGNTLIARVRVQDCRATDAGWNLECVFVDPIPTGLFDLPFNNA